MISPALTQLRKAAVPYVRRACLSHQITAECGLHLCAPCRSWVEHCMPSWEAGERTACVSHSQPAPTIRCKSLQPWASPFPDYTPTPRRRMVSEIKDFFSGLCPDRPASEVGKLSPCGCVMSSLSWPRARAQAASERKGWQFPQPPPLAMLVSRQSPYLRDGTRYTVV